MENEITNYTKYLFAAALKKCQDLTEAEELTQEVLLAALAYQKRGGEIANMRSWLSSTLNHKWFDLLRQKYKLPTISYDMLPEEMEGMEMEELNDTGEPTAEQIRREVAYLAKLQRDVIVRHYLLGQRVQDIADALGVPKGTVLSRLSSGREQMRKGLETMEQYEKQSYIPERLELGCHGDPGLHGEPWSLISNDLMKQNILIIAYEKPLTIVEIAKALGIPTPYVEVAVQDLVKSELMCQSKNKVFTDFMIETPEQILKGLDEEIIMVDKHYTEIWACVNGLFAELRNMEWYHGLSRHEKVIIEYYAMLDVFSRGIYKAVQRFVDTKEVFPHRPDGGTWIVKGNRYPVDFDFDNYRFRQYGYAGERRAYWEKFLNSKSIHLHVYDTQPDLNKYEHGPVEIHDDDLCKLLYIIHQEIPFDAVGFNLMFLEDIPHLAECGILRYEDGRPCVDIPVLTKSQYDELAKVNAANICRLADVLEEPLRNGLPEMKIKIPKHLEGRIAEIRQYSWNAIPMAVIKKAMAKGDFPSSADGPTPPMVLVIEQ